MQNGNRRNYKEWSKEELVREILALKKQKTYGLVWEHEKTKEVFDYFINWEGEKTKEEFSPESKDKFPVLAEVKDKEILTDKEKPVNLLIEGDNYHSLAVLNFTHKNAVDVIYIDPPYNTGNNDFKYNDKFVDKEDGYRHSKWLSFMSKRLSLAKNLLKETGVIFISIDDNEQASLKLLCDDIFGEQNFIANYIWESRSGKGATAKNVVNLHEYVLCYAKDIGKSIFTKDVRTKTGGSYEDEQGKYSREQLKQWGQGDKREDRPTMFYPVTAPDGTKVLPIKDDGTEGRWRISQKSMQELIKNGDVDFVIDNNKYGVYRKIREGKITKTAMGSLIFGVGTSSNGTIELKQLFKDKVFDTTKPTGLIKYVLNLVETSKNPVILDFFAGSGTTGHAVLALNKEDRGNRSFILCTNNENNICTDICYPRVQKVIKGYTTPSKEKIEGLGSNLKYFKTDFVEASQTDKNKRKLVDKCTEMLCIKENAFENVKDRKKFKIFKNNQQYLGIIFDDEYIEEFIEEAKKIDGKINVYVFSYDESVPTKEFKSIKNKVTLCPIPETILKVYRKVFKNDN